MTKGTSNLYPTTIEREAAINEAKVQLILKLAELERRVGSNITLENSTNFKKFQSTVNLFEVNINNGLPTVLLSASAFESALNRAKNAKWIYLQRRIEREGIHEVSKTFKLGLTDKGRKVAFGEVEKIADLFRVKESKVYNWIADNTILAYNI